MGQFWNLGELEYDFSGEFYWMFGILWGFYASFVGVLWEVRESGDFDGRS